MAKKIKNDSNPAPLVSCLVICILCLAQSTNTATAAIYYVDPVAGNDSDAGTSAAPWKTIAYAESASVNGSTVYLRSGNYGEIIIDRTGLNRASWADGVTYTAAPGHNPVFSRLEFAGNQNRYLTFKGINIICPPDKSYNDMVRIRDSSHLKVIDCNIVGRWDPNANPDGYAVYYVTYGVQIQGLNNGISDILIENCNIEGMGKGMSVSNDIRNGLIVRGCDIHNIGSSFISLDSSRNNGEIIIEYNRLHERWKYDAAHGSGIANHVSHLTIRGNFIHDYGGSGGIRFYEVTGFAYEDMLIENNLIYDSQGSTQMYLKNIKSDVIIRNNTFIGRYDFGAGNTGWLRYGTVAAIAGDGITPARNVSVYNNIFVGCVTIDPTIVNFTENYNIFWSVGSGGSYLSDPIGPNSIIIHGASGFNRGYDVHYFEGSGNFFVGGPLFDQYSYQQHHKINLDTAYRLSNTSPAINFGNPSNAPPTDILGKQRAGAPDAGCYEYNGTTPPSGSPPNADAGPDQPLTASVSGTVTVTLDGSHSSSPNGSIMSYVWTERGSQIATGANPTVILSIGQHTITLQVTDDIGLTDTDTVIITVEGPMADITPPSITSVTASESSVEIQFSEPLDGASAGSAGNYSLSDSLKIITVLPELGYNRVILYIDMQKDGKTHTLNVVNVKDVAGNPMPQTSVTYTYDSGLAGYYLFSDAGDNYILDSSGHNNTGYYINGAHRSGQQEAILGGGDDAVRIPTADWNAAQGTVALWINGTNMLGTQYIFGHSDGNGSSLIQLYTDNGYLGVGIGDDHLLDTYIQLLSPRTWYHITLSWDGTHYMVYVNGSLTATGTYAGLTLLNNLADIGNTGDTSSRTDGFQGLIDEVRIYDRALTPAEISNLALAFLPIGDKTVAEGNELSFTIRTRPDVTMALADSNLPSSPSFAANTFSWTPGYTNAGKYEAEFTSPHGTSTDFEKVGITVTDRSLPENNSPPIGYWKFDETSGNIASDSSGTGDTGYLKNGLTWGTGKINGAVVFSVPNDAVEISTTNFNLQQGTIAMWVYVQRQTLSRHYFFGHATDTANRIQLYDEYGYLCLGLGDSLDTSINIKRIQNKKWYHIVLTWNKPTYNVYVNGVLKASGTYSGLTAFADHADIGNNGFGRDMGLNGKIDDVQIYNRVLNTDEITRLDVGY